LNWANHCSRARVPTPSVPAPSHVRVTATYLWWYYAKQGRIQIGSQWKSYGGTKSQAWKAHQKGIWDGVVNARSLVSSETYAERIVIWKVLNNLESYYQAGHPADWALGLLRWFARYPDDYPATMKTACLMHVPTNHNVDQYFPMPTGYYARCTPYWSQPYL
jgi:hypothetical protein